MISETIVYACDRCQSQNIVRNGHNVLGKQRYRCKSCGKNGILPSRHMVIHERSTQSLYTSIRARFTILGMSFLAGIIFGLFSQPILTFLGATLIPLLGYLSKLIETHINSKFKTPTLESRLIIWMIVATLMGAGAAHSALPTYMKISEWIEVIWHYEQQQQSFWQNLSPTLSPSEKREDVFTTKCKVCRVLRKGFERKSWDCTLDLVKRPDRFTLTGTCPRQPARLASLSTHGL